MESGDAHTDSAQWWNPRDVNKAIAHCDKVELHLPESKEEGKEFFNQIVQTGIELKH